MEISKVDKKHVRLNEGFFQERQKINLTGIKNIHERFLETGRFEALKQNWKEGQPNKPHVFYDSDVAKWIESAAYVLMGQEDLELEKLCDQYIDLIEARQEQNGYFNSYFSYLEPDKKWRYRTEHELYCAGHLIEAAIAYKKATQKEKFLDIVKKLADHIYQVFVIDKSAAFVTPGHEEIELALYKLYKETNQKKYLELAKFFIDQRGQKPEPVYETVDNRYDQSHIPVRQQQTAEGHSVRALYLYSAMADLGKEYNDQELITACKSIFENIVNKRMYITGGVGSSHYGEAFTYDYDLPNLTAYAETCAAIALIMFCDRMSEIELDSKYADTIERALYNNVLAGVSLDGKSFFYENPLETDVKKYEFNQTCKVKQHLPILNRLEVFDCSCCPPNLTRLIANIESLIYKKTKDGLIINQYISSKADIDGVKIEQKSQLPWNAQTNINITSSKPVKIYLRIPYWAQKPLIKINQKTYKNILKNGYLEAAIDGANQIKVVFDMPVRLAFSHPKVRCNSGKAAVMRGPLVYCAESIDNPNIVLSDARLDLSKKPRLVKGNLVKYDIIMPALIRQQNELYSFKK
ncbi:MAG: glycoside hydrolase family 127 protein, partial [Clostridiales bacterium]|nr:glycoside hydrolase family 127 protein [Clostridiales bacterium]